MAKLKQMTLTQALKAGEWAKGFLGLEDWKISLLWDKTPPSWAESDRPVGGFVKLDIQWKTATIWADPTPLAPDVRDLSPLAILFHEFVHVSQHDDGCDSTERDTPERMEFTICRWARLMEFGYLNGCKVSRDIDT